MFVWSENVQSGRIDAPEQKTNSKYTTMERRGRKMSEIV